MTDWAIKPEADDVLRCTTPARICVGRAGWRPTTDAWLRFRQDHAMAKDAVTSEFSSAFISFAEDRGWPIVQSLAADKRDFISFPPKGKQVDATTLTSLPSNCPTNLDVQVVISDGLSARAIEDNIKDLLPMLLEGLELEGISVGVPIVVHYGRVGVADQIAHHLGMKLAINLIGERPGLSACASMSAYLTYNPGPSTISSDRTVVSNIHARGTLPVEAGAYVVQLSKKILAAKVSGVKFQQIS